MDCSHVRQELSAFMDNELDGATRRKVEHHLTGCPECREYFHDFIKVDSLVQQLPRIDVSRGFADRVMGETIRKAGVVNEGSTPFLSRLKRLVIGLSEAVFSLFQRDGEASTRTLDEFSDCPPFSMSSAYFKLLEHAP
jgi:anti-sigma factor RsiW